MTVTIDPSDIPVSDCIPALDACSDATTDGVWGNNPTVADPDYNADVTSDQDTQSVPPEDTMISGSSTTEPDAFTAVAEPYSVDTELLTLILNRFEMFLLLMFFLTFLYVFNTIRGMKKK